MGELSPLYERTVYTDMVVCVEEGMRVATLRYFARDGEFARVMHAATGAALPQVLEAREIPEAQLIFAWRSPTETWCLTRSPVRLSQLASALAGAADGCLVDLSGGLKVVRVTGARLPDLLCRLGGTGGVPQPGEARRSRLADVPVLTLSLRAGEGWLVVDRGYLPHVRSWIHETLLDFAAA
jgi:hypothetical protein